MRRPAGGFVTGRKVMMELSIATIHKAIEALNYSEMRVRDYIYSSHDHQQALSLRKGMLDEISKAKLELVNYENELKEKNEN